jgi:hypothetical protein
LENYKCPLFEFRFGDNPFVKKRIPSQRQLEALAIGRNSLLNTGTTQHDQG